MAINLRHFLFKNYVLFALMLLDIALNGQIDHQNESLNIVLLVAAQFFNRLLMMFSMFTLMWSTFLVRHGLIGFLCSRFKWVFIITPVSFCVTIGFHVQQLIKALTGTDIIESWEDSGTHWFYVAHNIVTLLYYAVTVAAAFELGDPTYYKPHTWLGDDL